MFEANKGKVFGELLFMKVMDVIGEFEAYYQEKNELLNAKITSAKSVLHDYELIVSVKDDKIKELQIQVDTLKKAREREFIVPKSLINKIINGDTNTEEE